MSWKTTALCRVNDNCFQLSSCLWGFSFQKTLVRGDFLPNALSLVLLWQICWAESDDFWALKAQKCAACELLHAHWDWSCVSNCTLRTLNSVLYSVQCVVSDVCRSVTTQHGDDKVLEMCIGTGMPHDPAKKSRREWAVWDSKDLVCWVLVWTATECLPSSCSHPQNLRYVSVAMV